MARIFSLGDYQRRRARAVEPRDDAAEVLLFTGVRYERVAEVIARPADSGPAGRRRRV